MSNQRNNVLSVVWAVLLHAGLLGGLALMALPCARFEQAFSSLGLPEWLNPVQCHKPLVMPGPVIQATLVGVAAAPEPKTEDKPPAPPEPPPPEPEEATAPEKPPVKTLPPPPDKPAPKDQAEVVARSTEQAELAAREQQERERQRQAELEADKLFAKLDKLKQKSREAEKKAELERQRLQQLADLEQVQTADPVPEAPKAASGGGGQEANLMAEYAGALTQTITQNWLRPDNIPAGSVCPIRITQIPGGQVIDVQVLPTCPFDEPGRRSVKNAVLRAQPLPYKGYRSVFQRIVTLNFVVQE